MSHLTFSRSLFILSFFLLFPFLPVQALMFRGVVLDKVTGDALIGATVVVKERPSLGTATGLDGSFLLKDLPESEETTLVVRYLGYSSSECVVNAKAGSVKIELEPEGQTLNEVLVEGKVDRTSDRGARYLERNAPAVMNVLSAKSIELSPDLTVAHALQRLSGVQM
ncbi:MAG: carboxypeptidase-like regulatory domain-containing protein [Porphyromonadaceae bacterium]|nr:carboxypeptidase-like regulatory domain-containing protein [Porphyromonadaceae bacterium]